jgi:hypothetical protein
MYEEDIVPTKKNRRRRRTYVPEDERTYGRKKNRKPDKNLKNP